MNPWMPRARGRAPLVGPGPAVSALLLALASLLPLPCAAATAADVPACASLDAAGLARARALMDSEFLYDCCDESVAACLAEPAPCSLAVRLAGEICRRVGHGEDDAAVRQALRLRARSMMPVGTPAAFDISSAPMLGEPSAPVVVVEYGCVRCPFCAALTPALEQAIRQGPLRGKVRLYYRLFPIKGHEASTEAGLAALAAHAQGRFWDFLALAYSRFDSFDPEVLPDWARQAGADLPAWEAVSAAAATREALVASKREGMANGVESTPTFFISGRRYHGELTAGQLEDVLLEEAGRLAGEH